MAAKPNTLLMRVSATLLLLFIGATQAPATEPASANTVAARNEAGGQQNLSHGTTRVNGVRLHYVAAGPKEGQAVVLLHGWPQTWYEWHEVMPVLAQAGYRVIAPDLRGFGESDKPQGGYDGANVARDIERLVAELGHEHIRLVGHDIGMMVAYAYASRYPEQVARLVVMEAALPGLGLDQYMDTAEPRGSWHFGFHMEPNLPEALVAGNEAAYLSHFFNKYAYDPTAIGPEELAYYARQYAAPGAARGGFMHYRAIPRTAEQNQRFAETELSMPVLAIGGEHSMGKGPFKQMEPLAGDLQSAVVARAGHWIPEERPTELARRLRRFFE